MNLKKNLVGQSKTKKYILILIFTLVFLFLIFIGFNLISKLNSNNTEEEITLSWNPSIVTFKKDEIFLPGATFNVEVADTVDKQSLGLMNRNKLEDNSGMLFIFETESERSFWMKNTLIPLDMIFIDSLMNVTKIHKNTIPLKEDIMYKGYGKYVLEINGGLSDKLNLEEGDTIVLQSIIN